MFLMLERYCQIRAFLSFLDHIEVEELLLSNNDFESVEIFVKRLSYLDLIAAELQSESTYLAEARTLFDGIIQKDLFVYDCLSATASIIENSTFEAAIVTVMRGTETGLRSAKLKSNLHLRTKSVTLSELALSEELSCAYLLFIRSKESSDSKVKYLD